MRAVQSLAISSFALLAASQQILDIVFFILFSDVLMTVSSHTKKKTF
jgi:hypothetical protein